MSFRKLTDNRTAVHINLVVRSLGGSIVAQSHVLHIHRVAGSRISRMDIGIMQ